MSLLGASFRKAFLDEGRLSMLVEAAPVDVIRNDKAALLGAARLAAQQLP